MPRNLQVVLVLLATFIAGGFAAWLLKPAGQGPAGAGSRPDAAVLPRPSGQSPIPELQTPDASQPPPTTDQQLPMPSLARGNGVIAGIVRWEDGSPCGGLALVAEVQHPARADLLRLQRATRPERLAYYREALAWQNAHSLHAIAGEDGCFEFNGVGDGDYGLAIDTPGIAALDWPRAVQAGTELELKVQRNMFIELDVSLEDRGAIDAAQVYVSRLRGGGVAGEAWRRGRRYPVLPGTHRVRAWGGPHKLYRAEFEFEVPPEGLHEPVPVVLKTEGALIVKPSFSEPYYRALRVAALPVEIAPAEGAPPAWMLGPSTYGGGWNPGIVRGISPGRYVVFYLMGTVDMLARAEVEYEGGVQEFEFLLPEPDARNHILLRVFGPEGEPLPGAAIEATVRYGTMPTVNPGIDRGGGEYWIRRIPPLNFYAPAPRDAPETSYTLRVTHPVFGTRALRCEADRQEPLDVHFGRKATLVVLLDSLPHGRSDLQVSVETRGSDNGEAFPAGGPSQWKPAAERVEFDVASGPVRITLRLPRLSAGWPLNVLKHRDVELHGGRQEIRLAWPPLTDVDIYLPEDASVSKLGVLGPLGFREFSNPGERLSLPDLPPGRYMLSTAEGATTFVLPGPTRIEFKELPYNAIRLERLDQGGVLEAAGLRLGDVITRLNGASLSGTRREVWQAFREAGQAEQVVATAERNGASMTFTVSGQDWSTMSGQLTAATRQ